MPKFLSRPITFFLLISLFFLILRLFNLPSVVNYGSDAARDFLVVWNMYMTKHPVLIGPPSEYVFNGRQFFFGPAPYYLILPALLIGQWDPLSVSYFLIFLNLAILIVSLVILNKNIKEKSIMYYFALFCACTPSVVADTQSYWNPYFMLPVSILLVALIVKNRVQKHDNYFLLLLIGFLFGLGLQFHYSFIFAIIVSCIWLFLGKKVQLLAIGLLLGGFVIGFSPLILFELRNHFYNLNTLLLIMTHSTGSTTGFIFNIFYLISLLPFLFYFVSMAFTKLDRINHLVSYVFFAVYILWSLVVIFSPHTYALSYPDAKQIAQKIEQDHPKNFNIVDQLTRDNRATAIRYLLTVHGFVPEGVTQYANVPTLYIYSKVPFNALVKNPVWEIKTFLPFTTVKTQSVSDNIKLYTLSK